MKKYQTIKTDLQKALADEKKKIELFADLKKTFVNEAIICSTMTEAELLQLLMYLELEKAMKNKKYKLVHDSNFAKSRAKTIDYRVSSYIDDANKRVLHYYINSRAVAISFASDRSTLEKIAVARKLKNAQLINFKYRYDIDVDFNNEADFQDFIALADIKDTYINVQFDDVINASKFALLILESTTEQLKAMLEAEQSEAIAE